MNFNLKNTSLFMFVIFMVFVGLGCLCVVDAADVHSVDVDNASYVDDSIGYLDNNTPISESDVVVDEPSIIPSDDANSAVHAYYDPTEHINYVVEPDEDNNFVVTLDFDNKSPFHWEITQDTYGAYLDSTMSVVNFPDRSTGTTYYNFHVADDHFFVRMILVDAAGNVIDFLNIGKESRVAVKDFDQSAGESDINTNVKNALLSNCASVVVPNSNKNSKGPSIPENPITPCELNLINLLLFLFGG